jgi:hydroxyacylglutathione hydrolase
MHVVPLDVPQLGNRCHLVHDGVSALVVDPPRDIDAVEAAAEDAGVAIVAVADTHVHNDYVSGASLLARHHHADYLLSAEERVEVERIGVRDGDVIPVGTLRVRVIDTPGHTLHHQSFVVSAAHPATPQAVFSGGSLLLGAVGRTDLVDRLLTRHLGRAQWESARRLGALGAETTLHPTHGFGSLCASTRVPASDAGATIGAQRLVNPALRRPRDAFVDELVEGLGPVPAYYRRMAPLNREGAGALPARPSRPLTASETEAVQRVGGWVVDVRSASEHVAGAVPGSVSIPYADSFATWVGWLIPWGAPLVLVARTVADLDAPLRDLARIGIEDVSTHVLGAAEPAAHGLHRRVTWADRPGTTADATHDPRTSGPVLLDVRQRDEVAAGPTSTRAHGALHVPLQELPARVHSLPPGELWIFCRSGYRAGIAASMIARTGRPVVHVDDDWAHVDAVGVEAAGNSGRGRAA